MTPTSCLKAHPHWNHWGNKTVQTQQSHKQKMEQIT